MANRKNNVEALLERSSKDIRNIKFEYSASLQANEVSTNLKINIKNFCENLRSVLDYLANEIREVHCQTAKPNNNFYFPIFLDRKQFESHIRRWFPDLEKNKPDLWNYLETIQPYHTGYEWLGYFNKLNNENKHGDLVEQIRSERKEVRAISKSRTQVNWNPDTVSFGKGVYIGGVPIDPKTQLPVPDPSQTITKITWIDFQFAGIEVSALKLLQQTLGGIRKINENVYRLNE